MAKRRKGPRAAVVYKRIEKATQTTDADAVVAVQTVGLHLLALELAPELTQTAFDRVEVPELLESAVTIMKSVSPTAFRLIFESFPRCVSDALPRLAQHGFGPELCAQLVERGTPKHLGELFKLDVLAKQRQAAGEIRPAPAAPAPTTPTTPNEG